MHNILAYFSKLTPSPDSDFKYKIDTIMHNYHTHFSSTEASCLFKTKDIMIILEGHIYNNPTSSSDIAWIASLYQQHQTKCFTYIQGIYSIVIYDLQQKKVYCAKDRVGAKQLYYYHDHKQLIIANRLDSLFIPKSIDKKIDHTATSLYFNYGFILQPYTIYQGCKKVKAGHYLTYDMVTSTLTQKEYWALGHCYDKPKSKASEDEIIKESHQLLLKSVKKRIPTNGTYAAFLSGGYDSTTIAALLLQYTETLQTFTIGFEEKDINEAHYAKEVAKHLGTKHTEYYFEPKDALEIIPKLSEIYEEPFADYGATPSVMLAQIANKAGIQTLFGGDGGDEVFATADDIENIDKLLNIPYALRSTIATTIRKTHPSHFMALHYDSPLATKITKFADTLHAKTIAKIIQSRMTLFTDEALYEILQHPSNPKENLFDSLYFGAYAQSADKITGSYFNSFLRDGELTKASSALNYHHINMRNPFLDLDLISFMATVPQSLKLKNNTKKYILKQITHQYIPQTLLNRPKMGFDIPFSKWMRGVLKPLLIDTVNSKNIKRSGILKHEEVIRIRDSFLNGDERYKYKLWSIFLYQLWLDCHF